MSLAIALLAGVAGAAPGADPEAAEPPPTSAEASAVERCGPAPATIEPGEIFVCAPRPQGYRLNPDLLEARRQLRSGRPKRPERMKDNSCASVGPAGCIGAGAGIDLVGAALTVGTMAARAARGENVGKMFVTDPQPTEYQLYVEAKRIREEKEAEAAAAAKAEAKAGASAQGD